MSERKHVPASIQQQVLVEAGYRCAVPTCRNILAIDLHHVVEVADGGSNDATNLLALCPTCHALYHRGTYTREAIRAWKGMLVSLTQAFDRDAIDMLLLLGHKDIGTLRLTGDGVLRFGRLLAAELASFQLVVQNGPLLLYQVRATPKGAALLQAWRAGDRDAVAAIVGRGA